jgi:NAD(P)-dependent dehydrogenase (short-subunit alcohol dehydrogenase family)
MSRFAGKSVVITGGSGGIGLAVARRICDEGGRVLVTGRNAERLRAVSGNGIHGLVNDASKPDDAIALAAEAGRLFGKVDALLVSAGRGTLSPLGTITLDQFRDIFEINVAGGLFAVQAMAPLMGEGGSIVLTASGAKTKGVPGAALYASSKGAVRSLTLVLARELGPRGIRVNTLSPGPIDTEFHAKVSDDPGFLDEMNAMFEKMVPMGRLGRVEEAAAVASFLLSDESTFVTGADYAVDGGEAQL